MGMNMSSVSLPEQQQSPLAKQDLNPRGPTRPVKLQDIRREPLMVFTRHTYIYVEEMSYYIIMYLLSHVHQRALFHTLVLLLLGGM